MKFYWLLEVVNQRARKAIDIVRVNLRKQILFYGFSASFPSIVYSSCCHCLFPSANPVGDACVGDFDGDGVSDDFDHCPNVKHLNKTSFTHHFTVDLFPGHSDPIPVWRVAKNVWKLSFFSWLHLSFLCLSRVWCERRRSWFWPTPRTAKS